MLKTSKLFLAIIILSSVLFTGCFGETKTKEEQQAEELEKNLEDLGNNLEDIIKTKSENLEGELGDVLKEAGERLKNLNEKDREKVELINFRELKKMLPNSLLGMERVNHEGATNGIMGYNISTAKAKYKDGKKSLEINIVDSGDMGQAFLGMSAWSKLQIDEESDSGYKKTTTFDGHKCLEECDTKKNRCQLNIIANDRFVFNLTGRGIDMDDMKKVLRNMEPGDLK